jgi:hypothetical protein
MKTPFNLTLIAAHLAMGTCLLAVGSTHAQTSAASSNEPRIVLPKEVVLAPLAGSAPKSNGVEAVFSAAGRTLAPTETVSWTFAQAPQVGDGQFAVMAGIEDVSPNCRWVSPTQLDCVFAAMPMPLGAIEMKFFIVSPDNQWQELAKASFTVEGATQSQPALADKPNVFTPSLIVGAKAQVYESHSAGALAPLRPTYHDATLQAGLQTENYGSDWSTKAQINIVGSSYHPEAVNFGAQGFNAAKVDIANYLVGATSQGSLGLSSVSLGNVQSGNHPLLANGIAHRGALLSQKFNERFDVNVAVQNGSAIVGAPNILGLADNEHRLSTASVGVELLERVGGLRVEATGFQGVVKPVLTGNVSTLQDAEQSKGVGLRLKAQNAEASLRGDVGLARSTYTPKGDSVLNILPGPTSTASAWYGDVAYDVLKNADFIKDFPLGLTVQAKREFANRGYKSIGAGQAGDYVSDMLSFNSSLGAISSQFQLGQRADNVDNSAAFLKNRSRTMNFTLTVPLAQLIDGAKPPLWAPALNVTVGRNRTAADTAFIPFPQTIANLPNMTARNSGLGLNWTIDKVALGYTFARTAQDNQQVGMEAMDLLDTAHNVTLNFPFNDAVSLTNAVGVRQSKRLDTGVINRGTTAQMGVNWVVGDRYTMTGSTSYSFDRDSAATVSNKTVQLQMQLLKQFDVSSFGMKMPAQWSVTYSNNRTNSLGTQVRYQTVNAGFSLSFF